MKMFKFAEMSAGVDCYLRLRSVLKAKKKREEEWTGSQPCVSLYHLDLKSVRVRWTDDKDVLLGD